MDINKETAKLHYYSQSNTHNYPEVLSIVEKLRLNHIEDSRTLFYEGRAYQELQQYESAIAIYDKSIDLNDNHSSWTKEMSSHNLSMIHFELDNYDACIKACRYNSTKSDNSRFKAHAHYLIAHSYYLKTFNISPITPTGQMEQIYDVPVYYEKATENILEALKLVDNEIDYIFIAGMIYKRRNMKDKAQIFLSKAASMGDSQAREMLYHL